MNTKEIECRFLEINKATLIKKLKKLGAKDKGERMLEETIIYDREFKWRDKEHKHVRIRKDGKKVMLALKQFLSHTIDGTYELEFEIKDYEKAEVFFEKIGLVPFRHHQKKRHTFTFKGVIFDIDTWPKIPTYVELEGKSEKALRDAAKAVGLDWNKAEFHHPRWVIENIYKIPISKLRWFTFDRYE